MKSQISLRRMSLLFSAFLICSFPFDSCKKDNSTTEKSQYEMSFDGNNKTVDYKTQEALGATFNQNGNQFLCTLSGYDANSNMNIVIYDNSAITTKSYSGYTTNGSVLLGVLLIYQDTDGTTYTEAADNSDAVVSITSLTNTSVKGTFSGTLLANGKPDMVISKGKFTLHRLN